MSLINREAIEQRERETLRAYAIKAAESRGRVHGEPEHPLRTCFQRDRDRIVHAAAFRRMEYKTQVFVPHEGDHYRTRLTHTVEVAQISRTLARCLALNEDLAEAVALAHDLGHTPFGHAGEDVLEELLQPLGGFNHNRQSLRVIDILEQRYPDFSGLNLSYEVREGIAKHETKTVVATEEFHPDEHTTLEASLVDFCDEIAYNAADLDDGLNAGLIEFAQVRELGMVQQACLPDNFESLPKDKQRYALARSLVDQMATSLVTETSARLEANAIGSLYDVRRSSEKLVAYPKEMRVQVNELKSFLFDNLYRHERLVELSAQASTIIRTLYDRFMQDHSLIPPRFQAMLAHERPEIVITDYIAGMTDRYAERLAKS